MSNVLADQNYRETALFIVLPRLSMSSPMPRTVAHAWVSKTRNTDSQRSHSFLMLPSVELFEPSHSFPYNAEIACRNHLRSLLRVRLVARRGPGSCEREG